MLFLDLESKAELSASRDVSQIALVCSRIEADIVTETALRRSRVEAEITANRIATEKALRRSRFVDNYKHQD